MLARSVYVYIAREKRSMNVKCVGITEAVLGHKKTYDSLT